MSCNGWYDSHKHDPERFSAVGDAAKMISKGFYYILRATAKYESLLPWKPPWHGPFGAYSYVCAEKKIFEKIIRGGCWHVCRAALRQRLRVLCCCVRMLSGLLLVRLARSSFDICSIYLW